MDANKLGAFITELRKEANMTQAELAQKLNVTVQAISKWERGKGLPDINTIEPLAKELGVSIIEIMKAERVETTLPQEEINSATKDIFSFVTKVREMQTQKWVTKGLFVALTLCICIWLGVQIYGYHHPYLEITYGTAHGENIYMTSPLIFIQEKSLLGYSQEIKQHLKEWSEVTSEMHISLDNQYEKPLSIVNEFEIKNGKTYIYYKGFGTSKSTGELESINKVISFDFVLTENLP